MEGIPSIEGGLARGQIQNVGLTCSDETMFRHTPAQVSFPGPAIPGFVRVAEPGERDGGSVTLRYVGIRVTNLERSVGFYTELLGLVEERRGTMSHGGVWVTLIDPESGQRIELNWYPPGSRYDVPYVPGEGLDHLGFQVPDALALYKELLAKGVPSAHQPWNEGDEEVVCYVKDPDDNWVELYTRYQDSLTGLA